MDHSNGLSKGNKNTLNLLVLLGGLLARLTERSVVRTAVRQILVAGGACLATYFIGGLLGASLA